MTERNCLSMLKNEPEVMTVIEAAKVLRMERGRIPLCGMDDTLTAFSVSATFLWLLRIFPEPPKRKLSR